MKSIVTFLRQVNGLEAALFAVVASLALTAGYASLTTQTRVRDGDITGTTHPTHAAPLANMQPMPDAIDQH